MAPGRALARPMPAHAELLSITPANGEIVDTAPDAVVITYSEPVSLTGGSARVLNDDAEVVSAQASVRDGVVTIPLDSGLPNGTYTVTWRVISADSHPVGGASVFSVGAPSSNGLTGAALDEGGDVAWGIRAGAVVLTAFGYAGALTAFGLWWFVVAILDRVRRGIEPDAATRRYAGVTRQVAVRAAIIGATTMVASLPFRIARVGGGLDTLGKNDVVVSLLRGPIGESTAVTVAGLLLVAIIASHSPRWFRSWGCGAAGLVALAGFVVEGHTRTQNPRWAIVTFDGVHLVAGACWLGGVVALVLAYRVLDDARLRGRLVRRFSTWALGLVTALAAAGVGMAWIILPGWAELTDTGWGLALLVKVGLVVVVVALAAYNRFRLVVSMSRRLAYTVMAELVLLLAVVGVTAVLVTRSPNAPVASAVGAGGAVPVVRTLDLTLDNGAGTAHVEVTPAAQGTNRLDIALLDPSGQPIVPVEPPEVELTQEALDIGPLEPTVLLSPGPGKYQVITDITQPGDWTITVRVRVSDFVSVAGEGTMPISG